MSYATGPVDYSGMTNHRLYEAALAVGFEFDYKRHVLQLDAGPKESFMLHVAFADFFGPNAHAVRRIHDAMHDRWTNFTAYVISVLTSAP